MDITDKQKNKIVAAAIEWARRASVFEIEPSPHYTELDAIDKAERKLFRVVRPHVEAPIIKSKTGGRR